MRVRPLLRNVGHRAMLTPANRLRTRLIHTYRSYWTIRRSFEIILECISIRHGDAGDAVASPKLKNWPLFGQKFSKFGQSMQLHSHVSDVVSIFQTKAK